jgi:hypothetical protein
MQRVGKRTIKELKRRGITGDQLRRQIWEPKTPSTTSINARYNLNFIIDCMSK